MHDIAFASTRKLEALDLTDQLRELPLADGFAWLSAPHTTGALLICEADPEMLGDLERVAEQLLAPFEPFRHRKNNNPNAAAHLLSSLFGSQLVLPIRGGQPVLGTYQRVLFLELDGPRDRRLQVAAIGGGSGAD